jgi:hypothetical protein
MRKLAFYFLLAQAVVPIGLSTSRGFAFSQSPKSQVGLCQIVPHIDRYLHKSVEISADLYGAWPHGFFLQDQGCPKKTIGFDYETSGADPSITQLDKFVSHNALHIGMIASGQFRGVIERDSSTGRFLFSVRSVVALHPSGSGDQNSGAEP